MTPRPLRLPTAGLLVAIALTPGPVRGQAPDAPYRNPDLPISARVADLLSRMTPEEKFWQLYMSPGSLDDPSHDRSHGAFGLQISAGDTAGPGAVRGEAARAHAERINAIQRFFVEETRVGIPIIPFDEALHGLVREDATVFPQAIGLAATWDTALVGRVSRAIAAETRSRGIRQVLSPVVNIASDVRWGRTEETYGEDPYLSSSMARAFVGAFEGAGVVATPKHFVANVGEGGRDSYPIYTNDRLLSELFFPPFVASFEAGARSVMTAYNSVDGAPATQNPWLLTEVLRHRWGFTGFVISDAAATGGATVLHMTERNTPTAAAHAWRSGLDVVFQSTWPQHLPYLSAVLDGRVPPAVLDTAVARVLRAKLGLGLFEEPYVDPDVAARVAGSADHLALAREAAAASIVLLRNEGRILPLERAPASVAVVGTDAVEARPGGYSAPATHAVSILDGLREAFGAATEVRYAPGPGRVDTAYGVVPTEALTASTEDGPAAGLRAEYFDNNRLEGEPRIVRIDERPDFRWTLSSPGRGIPFDWYSARWTGTLTVPEDGTPRLGIEGNDGYRLWLDGELVIDDWEKRSYGTRFAGRPLEPGRSYDLRLEYFESTGNARLKLVWDAGARVDWRARVDSAARLASESELAIVVAGIEEGEFRDRALLGLPGHQEELIRAVAATGTPTVVVIVGGSAVIMSGWIDDVGAVLQAWYPGEQGGPAVADLLLGRTNPAGRLPITFPMAEGQLPLRYDHRPTGRGDDYLDLTGQPLFPFGYGLSYTTFEYSGLEIDGPIGVSELEAGATATVRLRVRNTGDRAGEEVVQLYIRDVLASLARPVQQLRGFRRIRLAPGEERTVELELGFDDLKMLDERMEWVVEPGDFRVTVGASSRDIRLRGTLQVR